MTKILSLNIRIWTRDLERSSEHYWVERYRKIHDYIKSENPDIICLQEVWWPAKYVLRLGKLGYKKTGWGFSHPIYVRKGARIYQRAVSIFATMAVVDNIQYFSVHSRWEEKWFSKAMKWVKEKPRWVCYFIAGDFNRNRSSVISYCDSSTDSVRWLLDLESEDTFTNYKRPTESHGEIDHILTTVYFKKSRDLISYTLGPSDLSDHRPICLTFNIK